MKKLLNNEKGYSLLLTLMLVLLFAVLGASLMAMTFNGATKNASRENITQAKDLASKGIERMVAQLSYELDEIIPGEEGILAVDFAKKFDKIVSDYNCISGKPITQDNENVLEPEYSVCITNPPSTIPGSEESLRRNLTFESTGTVGKSIDKLYATYNMGATNYPEVLNYAVGSYKYQGTDTSRFPYLPGEGDLYLNGGVSITGDFKVDNNLYISETGLWLSGTSGVSEASVFPQVKGDASDVNTESKLFLAGNIYKFTSPFALKSKWESTFPYQKYVNDEEYLNEGGRKRPELDPDNTSYFEKYPPESIKDIFFNKKAPTLINEFVEISPIDFDSKDTGLSFDQNSNNEVSTGYGYSRNNLIRNKDTYLVHTEEKCEIKFLVCWKYTDYYVPKGDYKLTGDIVIGNKSNKRSGRFKTEGSLELSSSNTTFHNGAHIAGNLIINDDATIAGLVYVGGNLTINNSHLTSDAIFYVEGEVEIKESRIEGIIKEDKSEGSLIIFAKKDIHFSNNSQYDEDISNFKAYLYSEKTLEIFGVGSNVKIKGGISARKIILNAVRGDTRQEMKKECNRCDPTPTGNLIIDTITNQKSKNSRLQIEYDEDIIKNFSELDIQTEQWINNISPPVELERSYTAP